MARKPKPKTPREVFAAQVGILRERKGWTQQRLADEMKRLDHPIDRTAIAKIERGDRGVSIDEAFTLAVAFGVSPAALLLPRSGDVRVAPGLDIGGIEALHWFRGVSPLLEDIEDQAALRFFYEEVSDTEAEANRRFPGVHVVFLAAAQAFHLASDPTQIDKLVEVLEHIKEDIAGELRKAKREQKRA